jgi:hypothetical protein
MWCVRYSRDRCRLFHDYVAACRFYGRQESTVIQIQLWSLRAGKWESLAWQPIGR